MALPTAPDSAGTSTRPYLIRALHDWCTDNGYTPYIAVHVDATVRVPPEYVKNREIVLNVGFEATTGLTLGNETIEFKARFGGSPREIVVPVTHVIAIYARENGQGMAFPAPAETASPASDDAAQAPRPTPAPAGPQLALAGSPPAAAPAPFARNAPKKDAPSTTPAATPAEPPDPSEPSPPGRPALKRIK